MDFEYERKGNFYVVDFENGKQFKIASKWVDTTCQSLDISDFEAVEMWLTDNGHLVDEEQDNLDVKAKGAVKNIVKSEQPKKKTQRERVVKENPDKEYIIGCIAEYLEELQANNINITNKSKLIEFSYKNKEFKLDLVEKRKKKAE